MVSSKLAKAGLYALVFGLANFTIFIIVSLLLGGDAVNGHAENGRYFLDSHGKLTETSHAVFIYSKIHVYSLFVSHPLAMLGIYIRQRWKKQNNLAQSA